jgi:hypothetical protein
MARTYRRVPPNQDGWSDDFEDKLRRGHVHNGIRDPDGGWGETGNRKWAKKRKSRKNRLKAQQYIDEHLDELNL